MGRALFDNADFLSAARALAAKHGPAAVTVDSVTARLKAPKGSFYYRFASRDLLMGELWLTAVLAYQQGFVAAIEAGDGLAAALHTPDWVRRHLDDARLLLLYSRHDFVAGDWPVPLRRGVRDQAERFEGCLRSFARQTFGRVGAAELRRATFVLAEAPIAAVRQHLERREPPPPLVDELIAATYRAVCGPRTSLPGRAPVASPSR
jgi:AcrR family transcriptional regulator